METPETKNLTEDTASRDYTTGGDDDDVGHMPVKMQPLDRFQRGVYFLLFLTPICLLGLLIGVITIGVNLSRRERRNHVPFERFGMNTFAPLPLLWALPLKHFDHIPSIIVEKKNDETEMMKIASVVRDKKNNVTLIRMQDGQELLLSPGVGVLRKNGAISTRWNFTEVWEEIDEEVSMHTHNGISFEQRVKRMEDVYFHKMHTNSALRSELIGNNEGTYIQSTNVETLFPNSSIVNYDEKKEQKEGEIDENAEKKKDQNNQNEKKDENENKDANNENIDNNPNNLPLSSVVDNNNEYGEENENNYEIKDNTLNTINTSNNEQNTSSFPLLNPNNTNDNLNNQPLDSLNLPSHVLGENDNIENPFETLSGFPIENNNEVYTDGSDEIMGYGTRENSNSVNNNNNLNNSNNNPVLLDNFNNQELPKDSIVGGIVGEDNNQNNQNSTVASYPLELTTADMGGSIYKYPEAPIGLNENEYNMLAEMEGFEYLNEDKNKTNLFDGNTENTEKISIKNTNNTNNNNEYTNNSLKDLNAGKPLPRVSPASERTIMRKPKPTIAKKNPETDEDKPKINRKKEINDEIKKEINNEIKKEINDEIKKEINNEIKKEINNEIKKAKKEEKNENNEINITERKLGMDFFSDIMLMKSMLLGDLSAEAAYKANKLSRYGGGYMGNSMGYNDYENYRGHAPNAPYNYGYNSGVNYMRNSPYSNNKYSAYPPYGY